jgi:hypothetical protein
VKTRRKIYEELPYQKQQEIEETNESTARIMKLI